MDLFCLFGGEGALFTFEMYDFVFRAVGVGGHF